MLKQVSRKFNKQKAPLIYRTGLFVN